MSEAITRLEEKIAYLERHVVEQDKAMLEFADEFARLKRELKSLNTRLASGGPSSSGAENTLIDERPPHY
jgi:SlyX protein